MPKKPSPWTGTPAGWSGTALGVLTVVGLVLYPRPTLWFLLLVSFQVLCLLLIELSGPRKR